MIDMYSTGLVILAIGIALVLTILLVKASNRLPSFIGFCASLYKERIYQRKRISKHQLRDSAILGYSQFRDAQSHSLFIATPIHDGQRQNLGSIN